MKKIIYILSLIVLFSCSTAKAQNYKTHKVKSGETVETIAKKYNVSTTDIYKLNPDARKRLRRRMVLIIPNTKSVSTTTTTTTENNKIVEKTFDRYTKHKTRRKETLFSISQKYNITIEELKKHNKFLYANNLRKGDKLQIPVFKKTIKLVQAPKPTVKYVVKPKEGKWRIAYKYGITVQELEALNPNMSSILQPGETVIVPNLDADKVKQVDEKYSYYKVLPTEGFYRLKVKTGLVQEQLEALNPGLKETGLKVGMVLKVPFNATNVISENEPTNTATTSTNVDNTNLSTVKLSDRNLDTSEKNIAVMLPFTLNKINTDSIYDTKHKIKTDRTLSITLDFYTGVLVAFDSLKQLGVNLKVDVYDTQNRLSQVNSILNNNNFKSTDAVIGPLLTKNLNAVASNLERKNVPVISPMQKKINVGRNVFQSRPSDIDLKTKIISHFKADSTAKIIVVSDIKRKAVSTMLKGKFANASLVSSRLDKKTKKDAYYILEQDLINVIKQGNNVVFLETDNAGFISNVTSILNGLQKDRTKITLTTTKQNKAFEDEEVSNYYLSNLHFTYTSISRELSSGYSNSFVKRYKERYNDKPNKYAIRGFDLTMDVVLRLVTSENLYSSAEDTTITSYIENKFAYKKKQNSGYYNNAIYLVRHNNLQIEEVKQ